MTNGAHVVICKRTGAGICVKRGGGSCICASTDDCPFKLVKDDDGGNAELHQYEPDQP